MRISISKSLTSPKGVGAAQYASSAAPAGYRWDFVTDNGVRVTDRNVPVVDLVRVV